MSRSLCAKHYSRWLRHGDTSFVRQSVQKQETSCSRCGDQTGSFQSKYCPDCRNPITINPLPGSMRKPRQWSYLKRMNQQDKAKFSGQFIETIERIKVWDLTNGTCYLCFDKLDPIDWHVEHIIPLSRGGLHWYFNVMPSCPPCNRDKAEKLLSEMFQS